MSFITMNFFPIVCVVAAIICLNWGHTVFAVAFVVLAAMCAVTPATNSKEDE